MMKSFFCALAAAVMTLAALVVCAHAEQPVLPAPFVPTDRIMPISEVRPGMRGKCLTVARGSEIVSFDAEVIDIVPNLGAPKDLILIRVSGPVIDEAGGIAAGMSGSPMYIDGKLVGAIGYGWGFTKHDLGLVTSIEDMIKVWNAPERIPSFAPAPIIPDAPPAVSDDEEEDEAPMPETVTVEGYGEFKRMTPPLYVGGVSQRAAQLIGGTLGSQVVPFAGGSNGGAKRARYDARLRPGAAIGTSLVWGDVEISAIGTLSAVAKDGRYIAFAHPFISSGHTSAALTDAHISKIIPSLENPFKLGRTGDIIGIVTQDRPEGIGGRLGQFAPAASCAIRFTDIDAGRSINKSFQMVNAPYMISDLVSLASTGCIEDMWGRTGGGSARVVARVTGGALPQGWSRSNIFVSEQDVVKELIDEFGVIASIFSLNQFQEMRPFGIELDVELTTDPRVVYIEDVKVPDGPFAPGDTVSFDITLRAWRQEPVKHSYSLVVPEKVSGMCVLMVRGGGVEEEEPEYMSARWRSISSLPILLKELDAREANDQLFLEIRGQESMEDMIKRAQSGDPNEMMNEKLKSELRAEREEEGSMRVIRTNYYVDGMVQKLIRVDADKAAKPKTDESSDK